ncbi:FUSC family protein [Allonocardiopsis opalescens]|uniref:Putative membrane protein YccC n=1 Tax=Allonocardiopsis opalescens TaxID=1144618 RepID=A0A2T0PVA0_9ACTN|nr:FUSC family protein [Allonocardiopsis opalescens]PRX95437.1 putative membrane protein YccC [Allonocardiopsis opalescens]
MTDPPHPAGAPEPGATAGGAAPTGAVDRLQRFAAPRWLVETVRVPRDRPPWSHMARAAIAVPAPIAFGMALDALPLFLLVAMGAMGATMADRGGPYRHRLARLALTCPAGAFGVLVGSLAQGNGWITVVVFCGLALLSAAASAASSVGSVAGIQLLLFASLGVGVPLPGPFWLGPALFLAGGAWAVLLTLAGWPLRPSRPERESVAAAYQALTDLFAAVHTDEFASRRKELTTALNQAYDDLMSARAVSEGTDSARNRLVAVLNQANPITEAVLALAHEGRAPRAVTVAFMSSLPGAIRHGEPPPAPPEPLFVSPASRALHTALRDVADLMGGGTPTERQRRLPEYAGDQLRGHAGGRRRGRARWPHVLAEALRGHLFRLYAIRLTACVAVAATVNELGIVDHSYWVILTVALVMKPDLGSVFARAMQRGIGTVLGAAIGGAVLAVVPYGPWMLLPMALFAWLMPMGLRLNYGLFSTVNAPLVLLLVDLLAGGGWELVASRILDTAIGCVIVFVVGYAFWPSSWHADVGRQFADSVTAAARYTDQALSGAHTWESRRNAYRALSDLRNVFQRALSEPPALRRRITAWWPALVALERVLDTVAATTIHIRDEGGAEPDPTEVHQLTRALADLSAALRGGTQLADLPLPDGGPLEPVTAAVTAVRGVFRGDEGYPAAHGARPGEDP